MQKSDIDQKVFESFCQEDTEKTGFDFSKELSNGDFIAFFGDLGSGKTAFTRGIAKALCPNCKVTSPTFAIVNEYVGGKIDLFHFDMYRITDDDNLFSTGFYDYFDRNGIIITEWSENIPFALPKNRYDIIFEKTDETKRKITIIKRS